ncbi:uncharacterized protein BDR25DRAFT_354241 [Lindgomyces ingoldianus]|uniref:Uncharacterized protein n=1 Tax=Lindgomyces ingoldianus TaxID=673940 RepID=A0ACB6QXL9_9PLEO|nr:uncharacterized protein BDR25DRAFT_354241 [Lindgomyces ingoldianus]KAF2471748.1 hypothetical protein BDR25DRAFT_354241 [Lindgomyces ingoldianus]
MRSYSAPQAVVLLAFRHIRTNHIRMAHFAIPRTTPKVRKVQIGVEDFHTPPPATLICNCFRESCSNLWGNLAFEPYKVSLEGQIRLFYVGFPPMDDRPGMAENTHEVWERHSLVNPKFLRLKLCPIPPSNKDYPESRYGKTQSEASSKSLQSLLMILEYLNKEPSKADAASQTPEHDLLTEGNMKEIVLQGQLEIECATTHNVSDGGESNLSPASLNQDQMLRTLDATGNGANTDANIVKVVTEDFETLFAILINLIRPRQDACTMSLEVSDPHCEYTPLAVARQSQVVSMCPDIEKRLHAFRLLHRSLNGMIKSAYIDTSPPKAQSVPVFIYKRMLDDNYRTDDWWSSSSAGLNWSENPGQTRLLSISLRYVLRTVGHAAIDSQRVIQPLINGKRIALLNLFSNPIVDRDNLSLNNFWNTKTSVVRLQVMLIEKHTKIMLTSFD